MKRFFILISAAFLLSGCLQNRTEIDELRSVHVPDKSFVDGPLKFLVVSDMHPDFSDDAVERIEEVVRAAEAEKVDFIIQLGDFIGPARDPQSRFLNALNSYTGNILHVLGNHDMDRISKKTVMKY